MDILSRGDGALFTDPSADRARQFFAAKPRALTDKLTTVADAVAPARRTTAIISPSAASAATAFPPPSFTRSCGRASRTSRFAGHTATHDFQILCAGNLTGRGQTLAARGHRLRRRPGGARPVAARPPGHGVGRGRLHRVDQLRPGRALQGRRDGPAVPAGALAARHRHLPPQRRPRRSPAPSPARRWPPCRPCIPTSPPSTSTRPTATATAASAAPPSPTSTWPAPPSGSSSPASG